MKYLKPALLAASVLLTLSACGLLPTKKTSEVGTLNRTLLLVDADGTRYGTVEMSPVSGGRMFDTQGRLMGTIVTPTVTSTVTTVTPVVAPMPAAQPVVTTMPVAQPYPIQ